MLKAWIFFFPIFLFIAVAQAQEKKLCPHVILKKGTYHLDKNEKILVCGAEDSASWKTIPLEQAQYQLKILFQNQGYFEPRFEIQGEDLWVDMGTRSEIKTWDLQGEPAVVDKNRKRKVIGEAMTPAKVTETEKWIETKLNSIGYACPKITSKAEVWDSHLISHYDPGLRLRIFSQERKELDGLEEDTFRRFQAFDGNDWYDSRKLQITSNRLLSDGLAQSSYFTEECHPEGIHLVHHLEIGEPRILRVGFGASSEEFPFFDIWFKNTRLDSLASSYWLLGHASPILQSLEGSSELYLLPWSRDSFVGPRFRFSREVEDAYEVLKAESGADLGRNWDLQNTRLSYRVGPTFNYVNTIRGIGPDEVSYVSFEGSVHAMNHDYELLIPEQTTGFQTSLEYQGQREGIGSTISAEKWTLKGKDIWNINDLHPAYLVLATRFEGDLTNSENLDQLRDIQDLPTEYRTFLGGEQNLRGFPRQSLNNRGLGYLTAVYLGVELRLVEELPWNLEPLLLWDGAKAGLRSWILAPPLFQSTGFGVRWRSPFGTIRLTAAKGSIQNEDATTEGYPQQWVYLFSFGKEF